jgi:hypothetical protein
MNIDIKVLTKIYSTYGVNAVKNYPQVDAVLSNSKPYVDVAPAECQSVLKRGGYQFMTSKGYFKPSSTDSDDGQVIYYIKSNNWFIWVWEHMFRILTGEKQLSKWILGNEKYPKSKAVSFMETYKKMVGIDTAASAKNKPEMPSDMDRVAGIFDLDIKGGGERMVDYKPTIVDPTDALIAKLTKQAGSKKTLPADTIIDVGLKAKNEKNTKLLQFLSTIKPLNENFIKKDDLQKLIRGIIKTVMEGVTKKNDEKLCEDGGAAVAGDGGMSTTSDVSPVTGPNAFKSKKSINKSSRPVTENEFDGKEMPKHNAKCTPEEEAEANRIAKEIWGWQVGPMRLHSIDRLGGKHFWSDEHSVLKSRHIICKQRDGAWIYVKGDGLQAMWVKFENEPLAEITTTNSVAGYNIPGAFSRAGGSARGVESSDKLGYQLTKIGKEDMKLKADKLCEDVVKNLNNLRRAQLAHDDAVPSDDPDAIECPDCGGDIEITSQGQSRGCWWTHGKCPECGYKYQNDNFDQQYDL